MDINTQPPTLTHISVNEIRKTKYKEGGCGGGGGGGAYRDTPSEEGKYVVRFDDGQCGSAGA